MGKLSIHHRTSYRYQELVTLSPHRIMLRPRESRELRLRSHDLSIVPEAQIRWSLDVFGNAVATVFFSTPTNSVLVESIAAVELTSEQWPIFDIDASAINYPFMYADRDYTDLGALTTRQYVDVDDTLRNWARGFIAASPTDTLSLLKDVSLGIASTISYQSREEEGTQGPLHTLERGWGSCRDFAVLFAEAVRSLGFGARLVSGYLFNPIGSMMGSADSGSTHAWAEVFIPGAGWITFDPTNRSMGGANLIPVAVVRDIRHAVPVAGNFTGRSDAFLKMNVLVEVKSLEA